MSEALCNQKYLMSEFLLHSKIIVKTLLFDYVLSQYLAGKAFCIERKVLRVPISHKNIQYRISEVTFILADILDILNNIHS